MRNFDTDGSGVINSIMFRRLMTSLGEPLSEDEVQLLVGHEDDTKSLWERSCQDEAHGPAKQARASGPLLKKASNMASKS